jgi:sugar (pentulose or hexulose) kinase
MSCFLSIDAGTTSIKAAVFKLVVNKWIQVSLSDIYKLRW